MGLLPAWCWPGSGAGPALGNIRGSAPAYNIQNDGWMDGWMEGRALKWVTEGEDEWMNEWMEG